MCKMKKKSSHVHVIHPIAKYIAILNVNVYYLFLIDAEYYVSHFARNI